MNTLDKLSFKADFQTHPDGAGIIIDGIHTGKITPALIDNLTPEPHRYVLVYEGYMCAEGNFNPLGWRDFTAQIFIIIPKRKNPIKRARSRPVISHKYDPLNPRTWRVCPVCKAKLSEIPFKCRKHECECRNCGEVFKVRLGNRFKHPLKPWKDPESLICSKKLKEITGKDPEPFVSFQD